MRGHTTATQSTPRSFARLALLALISVVVAASPWMVPSFALQAGVVGQRDHLGVPTVVEVQIPTAMRDERLPATIVLPSAYAEQPDRAFPVLYLLHGAGDEHTKWIESTEIEELAEAHEVLVVCPDGGSTSWYFDSPIDPSYQFETFIAEELVAHIDANYRTRKNAKSRAIAGLSMGGHGALFLGIRHSDVFATAVVLSGGVDIRPYPNNWDIAKRLGSIEESPEVWEELTAINQARSLRPGQLAISIDCGVGDFFINANRALHERLLEMKIEHDYTERPGGHRWGYWSRCLPYQMIFISEQFER